MTRSDLVMVERELDQPSIATKQATDETAASVLSEPPEAWADCETCGGEGAINRTIHVYENGCGFSHPDVEIIPCTDCMGTGGAIVDAASTYCDICGGDCSSANPPVFNCPLAKQESCPESAPRTETTVRDWRKSVFTYEHDDAAGHLYYFAPQVTAPGPFLEQRHVQAIVDIASDGTFAGVELIDNMPPLIRSGGADTESDGGTSPSNETRGGAGDDCSVGKRGAWPHHDGQVCAQRLNVENQNPDVTGGESAAPNSAQLTKTPSADHDAGNLRGLAEPNHQPHAVSQGWRTDLENAPGGVRFLIAGRYPNGIWYVEESYRHYAGHFNGRKIDPPTHWMPLPAPPSPAKTDPAPSSVEEWGR